MLCRLSPLSLALFACLCLMLPAAATGNTTPAFTISAQTLQQWLASEQPPVVLDVRPKADYLQGHVPGARQLWRPDYHAKPGLYAFDGMRTHANDLYSRLSRLGVTSDDHLVLYSHDLGKDAYYLAWLLQLYGHPSANIRMLDGQLPSWQRAGLPLSRQPSAPTLATLYQPAQAINDRLVVSATDLAQQLDNPNTLIVSHRSAAEHLGFSAAFKGARRGNIPGSIRLDVPSFFDDNGLKSNEQLQQYLLSRGVTPDKRILIYSSSGAQSALSTLVLSQVLGYPHVQNFEGGWNEWQLSGHPVHSHLLRALLPLLLTASLLALLRHGWQRHQQRPSPWAKLALLMLAASLLLLLWHWQLLSLISLDRVHELQDWIQQLGWLGPVLYILMFACASVLFLPALPFTLLGAIAFGPIWGTVFASLGSSAGACLAFVTSRYLAREFVEGMIRNSPSLQKIDDGVQRQGWRMLMITRLVPIFPFNVLNYVYGITKIPFALYALLTWVFMLPGTTAYVLMAGAVVSGADLGLVVTYFSVGATLLALLSLLPSWFKRHGQRQEDRLL